MKGLDAWITGNYGEDHPDNKPTCEWCDAKVYKRGLCRECYEAGLEDKADAEYEEFRIKETQWDSENRSTHLSTKPSSKNSSSLKSTGRG